MKVSKTEHQEAIDKLKEMLPKGTTVYTVIRSVTKSGMSRTMDIYTISDNRLIYLTGWVAKAIEYNRTEQGAMKVPGCGMDMGFHVVYSLSETLYEGNGKALKQEWI